MKKYKFHYKLSTNQILEKRDLFLQLIKRGANRNELNKLNMYPIYLIDMIERFMSMGYYFNEANYLSNEINFLHLVLIEERIFKIRRNYK